ncbi:MAG: hypothetical protein A3E83_05605 [Gammaproteobacteria bacterium RIFCSPHIGHO2_12_FULL_41_20]|nr:MAG: hypothetical protein A3E83_05605 [Gammaproteobacteria bacterium RIFCSPHIGHO2_12_FULL_41_20]
MPSKYIFVNGVMRLNPAYQGQSSVANPQQALAIVSSASDIAQANEERVRCTGQEMQLAPSTISAMTAMQDRPYLDQFKTSQPMDGGDLLDGLYSLFEKYEVPIGLVNKLLTLTSYDQLDFIIDDSGSMRGESDVQLSQATDHVRSKALQDRARRVDMKMTRWEEVEDRLHVLMDILAYLPVNNIRIHFLNRGAELSFSHAQKTPEQFSAEVHDRISREFSQPPAGMTPLYGKLAEAFRKAGKTMHYVFTDGVPSDASVEAVSKLVKERQHPENHPLTFMSCTNNDNEAKWMKEIEEIAKFVSELDDFKSEREEVLSDQGVSFPFSRGFWLLCQLVAATNPDDLDALDESTPFSRYTLSNLLGREMSAEEYQSYFHGHPNASKYSYLYQRLLTEPVTAKQLIQQSSQTVPSYYSQQPSQTVPNYPQQPYGGSYQPTMFASSATPPPPPFPGPMPPQLPEYSGYRGSR